MLQVVKNCENNTDNIILPFRKSVFGIFGTFPENNRGAREVLAKNNTDKNILKRKSESA